MRWALPHAGAVLLALALASPSGVAHAATYKWVDEKGVIHYTDKMPPEEMNKGRIELNKQGVPVKATEPAPTPELMQEMGSVRINPDGIFPQPLPVEEAAAAVGKLDGYAGTEADQADMQRQWPQLKGQFLIDRDGIVRWANIEASEGPAGVGKFPSAQEIMAAARALKN